MSAGKLTIERVYLITSLTVLDATCTELAVWTRGHWGIENLLHHVRERTLREDDSKARTGTLPRHGLPAQPRHQRLPPGRPDRLAAVLRHTGRDHHRPLRALGLT
ncbi:hypothetical protein [Streptomyces sp. S584]|uniref:hypothetical protein n=1 Tax=Streptomyces sp. S584 TaxID=3096010 RepID=UPI002AFEE136|nr:hypothetical protein [Streptomyces sp. S584]